jgi:putative spermidine/putrescine transport system permease protein
MSSKPNPGLISTEQSKRDAPKARPAPSVGSKWLGVLPFFVFIFIFVVLPSISLFVGSFQDNKGNFTFKNLVDLAKPEYANAYWVTIRISLVTAVAGGILGFMMAYAVTLGGLPRWVRSILATFSGVASNFAGVPLAFAFVATLGRTGMVTVILKALGVDLYDSGFSLYSFWGLSLTYMYFQFPLMVLIITPALDGLRKEWREAAENLGASSFQYWTKVALPILMPSILGCMVLLFGNSFGAYATALSLTGGFINLITVVIGSQIKGDVLHNVNLGYAMAFGMVLVMSLTMVIYYFLRRRSERWLRQ